MKRKGDYWNAAALSIEKRKGTEHEARPFDFASPEVGLGHLRMHWQELDEPIAHIGACAPEQTTAWPQLLAERHERDDSRRTVGLEEQDEPASQTFGRSSRGHTSQQRHDPKDAHIAERVVEQHRRDGGCRQRRAEAKPMARLRRNMVDALHEANDGRRDSDDGEEDRAEATEPRNARHQPGHNRKPHSRHEPQLRHIEVRDPHRGIAFPGAIEVVHLIEFAFAVARPEHHRRHQGGDADAEQEDATQHNREAPHVVVHVDTLSRPDEQEGQESDDHRVHGVEQR